MKLFCIKCNKSLENFMGEDNHQPIGGLSLVGYGHYGCTVWDPMNGSFLEMAICDSCLSDAIKNNIVKQTGEHD
jgi:hypothetical protein